MNSLDERDNCWINSTVRDECLKVVCQRGPRGVGIASAFLVEGRLNLQLTNGNIIDVGEVVGSQGEKGSNGVSVSSVTVNENYDLIVYLSDGNILNAGSVLPPPKDKDKSIASAIISINNCLQTQIDRSVIKTNTGEIIMNARIKPVMPGVVSFELHWYQHSDESNAAISGNWNVFVQSSNGKEVSFEQIDTRTFRISAQCSDLNSFKVFFRAT